jgi:predicted nucleic acid-binding protein
VGVAGGSCRGVVRIVTQSIFDPPATIGQAVEFIDHLLGSPTVHIVLGPGARHWELLRKILDECQVRGGLATDAVIVALCREHGVDTVLSDRFPGVKVVRLSS